LKVLFDQGTPVPLRNHFSSHHVSTAYELGWATLKNGELLAAAESNGFEVFCHHRYKPCLSGELIQQNDCHRCSKYHQLAPHSEKRL
jgi:hypothetical protein